LYANASVLLAVPFDTRRLEAAGDPVPVLEQVANTNTGAAEYVLRRTGAVGFVPGGSRGVLGAETRSLVWVDRRGREVRVDAPVRPYDSVRLSPDNTQIALQTTDQDGDIWIWHLARRTLTRLSFDPSPDI